MDFGSLLHAAKQNENVKKEVKYYTTKFEPPKKEQKNKTQLSINIQKFLAKKEEEEKQKALEAKRKRDELLAKRDPKLKKKILKHLKVCKSANKSVLEDAIDHVNTAVTLQGCDQPDEDDYGYVSQEASAFYSKMMEKYSNIPEEKKFPDRHKRVNNDLMSTKDRVRAALEREKEEALLPHKRHRRTKAELGQGNGETSGDLNFGRPMTYSPVEDQEKKRDVKPKPKKPMPPPLDFNELLKIAQQKQLEPVKFEPKIEKQEKEPERLMTSKEKKEFEEMQARKEGRKRRDMERQQALNNRLNPQSRSDRDKSEDKKVSSKTNEEFQINKTRTPVNNPTGRIPKLNGYKPKPEPDVRSSHSNSSSTHKSASSISNGNKEGSMKSKMNLDYNRNSTQKSTNEVDKNSIRSQMGNDKVVKRQSVGNDMRNGVKQFPSKPKINDRPMSKEQEMQSRDKQKPIPKDTRVQTSQSANSKFRPDVKESRQLPSQDVKTSRQFPPNDIKPPRQFPPNDLKSSRQFPPSDVKTPRQFPPKDVRGQRPADRGMPSKNRKPVVNKRRILDDDSEYDSELDDFIDDGPEETDDYSKYIKDIFGYDKSRYRDEDEDDMNMESNFAQVMREEYISKKIGIMEDLEDMKMEAMEKKMKAKKKRLK